MTGKAGLKAGLIGLAVMIVWTIIGRFLPLTGIWMWLSMGINLLLYTGVGVLAGFFLASPRTPGQGAGAGAIAGLISGVISSAISLVIFYFQMSSGGNIPGLSPEQIQQLEQAMEMGVSPAILLISGSVGVCCTTGIGSGLAAIGGAIFGAVKPD